MLLNTNSELTKNLSENRQELQPDDTKHIMSRIMRKPDFCICENKGADQLCSNCTADQHLCFRYSDSTIPLLLIAKISSL